METPLKELIIRRYESPHNLSKRDTLKKICLSLGLLQPGDSRDIIVDILYILEKYKHIKKLVTAFEIKDEVVEIRQKFNLSLNGTADSNVRRQIKRLREVFLAQKVKNSYRIFEYMDLKEIFEKKIKLEILNPILERNEDFFNYYNSSFETKKE